MFVFRSIKRAVKYIFRGVPIVHKEIINAEVVLTESSNRLRGKRIVVTGGTRGLGLAMAEAFCKEGASVLIAGRNEMQLRSEAERLRCAYETLDLQTVESFDYFITRAHELLGGVDVLVNNGGISLHEQDFMEVTPEGFDAQLSTNFRGSFFLTQAFVKYKGNDSKTPSHIIFITSETGFTVDDRPYGWTKAAMNSMIQGLAYRLADKGFHINGIAPGVTASEMTGFSKSENLAYDGNLIGRAYLPEEVARVAVFLLSNDAACLNGQIIYCNNGNHINARWK